MAHAETIATYDTHAADIATLLDSRGPRAGLIETGLQLAGDPAHAIAVEVGCGAGRDAGDIIARVGHYKGFDPSRGLVAIARQKYPDATFTVSNAASYEYPANFDVAYGFASFVHLGRDEFGHVCERIAGSLKKSGAIVMSLREGERYEQVVVNDAFGRRTFYNYDLPTVKAAVEPQFTVRCLGRLSFRQPSQGPPWMFLGLQKR